MSLITLDVVDDVATIRFNSPATLNSMSVAVVEEMRAALTDAEKNARALVITGEGRAFCSGAALGGGGAAAGGGAAPSGPPDAGAVLASHFNPLMVQLRDLSLPFVTAVHGAAAGVGCSIALMGDLIVADSTAYFLQAFRNIGLVPDGGSPYLLASAAGRVRAMEAMLLGERIPAADAYQWGMVNRLVPEGKDIAVATELAKKLADGPRHALGLIRKLAWGALDKTFEEQLDAERYTQKIAGQGKEFREGVMAFLQKRKANFRDLA